MVGLAPLLSVPGLEEDLVRVETAMVANVTTGDPFLSQVAGHLISAGGKRLRPALAVAVGEVHHENASDDVIMGAVAVELVHLGSLYHDDVMDEARTRRNVESVNSRWGNLVAILAGDFLLARASGIAASLGTEVAALLAATIGQLCEGQVRELSTAFDVGRTEEAYLSSIAGKTAALMATACRIGAITSGMNRDRIDAFTAYGERVGMVFQIVDDILDVIGTDEGLGKPAGNDLLEGIYTLPVIRALATPAGDELRPLLGGRLERDVVDRAREIVRSNGAVPAAITVAGRYAAEAKAVLGELDLDPTHPVVAGLSSLGDHLISTLPAA